MESEKSNNLVPPPPPLAPDLDATLAPPVISGSNRAPARHGPERRLDKNGGSTRDVRPRVPGLRELFSPNGRTLAEVLTYGTTTAHAVRAPSQQLPVWGLRQDSIVEPVDAP